MDLEETVAHIKAYTKEKSPTIIFLTGDLGAGKTHLTNAFAHAIDVPQRLPSPTFTFLQEYACSWEGKKRIIHADFYRIEPTQAQKVLEQIGFWDYIEANTIIFIEWPERAQEELKDLPHTTINITLLENGNRNYEIS